MVEKVISVDRKALEKAHRPTDTTIGVLRYGQGKKYAIFLEENLLPVCIFATQEDFLSNGIPLPDINSDRVLDLDPQIEEINVYSAAIPDDAVTRTPNSGITPGEQLKMSIKAVQVHNGVETEGESSVNLDQAQMLRIMYGPYQGSNSGIISFDGPNRVGDAAVLVERVESPDGKREVRSADILLFTPNMGTSSIDGAREFLATMIAGFRLIHGSKREYARMWEVADAIDSSPSSPVQEQLVIAYLVAEQLLGEAQLVDVVDPDWRVLYKHLTSFKNRLQLFMEGKEVAAEARYHDIADFIRETLGDILLSDYKSVLGDVPVPAQQVVLGPRESHIPADIKEKLKTDIAKKIYLLAVEQLKVARESLYEQGDDQVEKGEGVVLNGMLQLLNKKARALLNISTDKIVDADLDVLGELSLCYQWLFSQHRDWWVGQGDVWFSSDWRLRDPASHFMSNEWQRSKDKFWDDADKKTAVSIGRVDLEKKICLLIQSRIAEVKRIRLEKAMEGA